MLFPLLIKISPLEPFRAPVAWKELGTCGVRMCERNESFFCFSGHEKAWEAHGLDGWGVAMNIFSHSSMFVFLLRCCRKQPTTKNFNLLFSIRITKKGLYDYPQIIKKPMDLGTVKKNVVARSYPTINAAAEDVRLVWVNCMTYNADGSDFFMLAKTLQKRWDDKLNKYMTDFQVVGSASTSSSSALVGTGMTSSSTTSGGGVTSGGNGPGSSSDKVTLDDKKAFAKSLFKLTKEDLGKIIVEIDTKSPGALTKNSAEDECEINVDKIPPQLLSELKAFIISCTTTTNSTTTSTTAAAASSSTSTQPPKKKKKQ